MTNIEKLTKDVEEIKSERGRANYIQHEWLRGFRELTENVKLSRTTTKEYLEGKLNEVQKFTVLVSSNFYMNYPREMMSGEITIKQLPMNEEYHLQFPLLLEGNFYKFMLTPCSLCEGDQEHNLPLIELRKSVNLSKEMLKESAKTFKTNAIMYDNRISPRHLDKEIINLAYISLNDLIVNNQ